MWVLFWVVVGWGVAVTCPRCLCQGLCVGAVVWLLFRVVVGWGLGAGRVWAWWFQVLVGGTRGSCGGGAGLWVWRQPSTGSLGFLEGVEDLAACVARPAACR